MRNLLKTTLVAATAALAFTAAPAAAAPTGPSDRNATASARIIKPLTLAWAQDLDLGTVLLGPGAWTGASVAISKSGVFSCPNINVTCSGTTQVAKYTVTGTNNQTVTVSAPNVTLVNGNDNTKTLLMTVDSPGTVTLGNSGNTGVDFALGGSISVDAATTDGVYTGTFNVTVDY